MCDTSAKAHHDRQCKADVFAAFYADLYNSMHHQACTAAPFKTKTAQFSLDEVWKQIRSMKNNKCSDASGIVVELLKEGSQMLVEIILDLFNDILDPGAEIPSKWRLTCI